METLGSFILNRKNKFLTFSYKKRKITLQDITLKVDSVTPKDIQDISKVIFQEGKKVLQNMQRKVDKITTDKNEEVSRLKDHSRKLLTQIKKLKNNKKSLKDKLEQLTQEVLKSPVVTVKVEDKGTNSNQLNVTTQEEDKQVEENPHLDVAVQMMNTPTEGSVTNSTTSSPEEN